MAFCFHGFTPDAGIIALDFFPGLAENSSQ
jgi:hypothetical protein